MQPEEEICSVDRMTGFSLTPVRSPYPACIQTPPEDDDPEPGITLTKIQCVCLCLTMLVLFLGFLLAIRS